MSVFEKAKKIVARELDPHEYNSDGQFRYSNSPFHLPNFLARRIGTLETLPDRRVKKYGRIRGNIFAYMTMPMFIVSGLVVYAVALNVTSLIGFFETNIYLNGLIISLAIFGLLKTFQNSFYLYKTASFIRFMERVLQLDKIEKQNIFQLRRALEKPGVLVNTVFMAETIDNIEKFGHPNFNDNRARLIKSKLGFRVAKNKGNVSFISGLLVMLGLLGTFLGLLGTIDAVGEALNSMSNIGGDSGEVGVEEMTMFIGSLAEPLQGMGLAFSSSLFGLSGSMLIGFFLYLQGTPQNAFIENFSRWIDDRIEAYKPDLEKKIEGKEPKVKIPPKDADLKDWLTGFVHMSVKTNHRLSELTDNVSASTQVSQEIWADIKDMLQVQQDLNASFDKMNDNFSTINSHLQVVQDNGRIVADAMPDLLKYSKSSAGNAQRLNVAGEKLFEILPSMNGQVATLSQDVKALSSEISNNQSAVLKYFEASNFNRDQQAQAIKILETLIDRSNALQNEILSLTGQSAQTLLSLNQNQITASTHTENLVQILKSESNIEQAGTLIQKLNLILKDFNDKMQNLTSKD